MALLIIDHKPVCIGNKTCTECGRPGCNGCICEHGVHLPHQIGKCIICAGIHKEESVILYSAPIKDWDK